MERKNNLAKVTFGVLVPYYSCLPFPSDFGDFREIAKFKLRENKFLAKFGHATVLEYPN